MSQLPGRTFAPTIIMPMHRSRSIRYLRSFKTLNHCTWGIKHCLKNAYAPISVSPQWAQVVLPSSLFAFILIITCTVLLNDLGNLPHRTLYLFCCHYYILGVARWSLSKPLWKRVYCIECIQCQEHPMYEKKRVYVMQIIKNNVQSSSA